MLLNILFFNRLVSSESELLSVVSEGMQRRATHSTHVHEHSSRSHLIVTIHITARGEGGVSIASSVSSLQLNTTITPVSSTDSTPLVSFQGRRYNYSDSSPPRCLRQAHPPNWGTAGPTYQSPAINCPSLGYLLGAIRVPPRGTALCSMSNCSWWIWLAVSVSVRKCRLPLYAHKFRFINCFCSFCLQVNRVFMELS